MSNSNMPGKSKNQASERQKSFSTPNKGPQHETTLKTQNDAQNPNYERNMSQKQSNQNQQVQGSNASKPVSETIKTPNNAQNSVPSSGNQSAQTEGHVVAGTTAQMQGSKNKRKVLDINEVMKLPIKTVKRGDQEFSGRYDETTSYMYFVDKNGNLTGKVAKITITEPGTPPPPKESEPKQDMGMILSAEKEKAKNKLTKLAEDRKNKTDKKEKKPRQKLSKKKLIIICLIIVVVLLIGICGTKFVFFKNVDNGSTPTQGSSVSDSTEMPIKEDRRSNDGSISVIELQRDIIPGEMITEEVIKEHKIDSQTYNQLVINGTDLYKWEQKDNIVGMYAAEYISKDHYITTSALTTMYQAPLNVWGGSDGINTLYVDVPINEELASNPNLLIGAKVNIRYKVDESDATSYADNPTSIADMSVVQEEVITTAHYAVVNGVTVANMLTVNGDNLYERYAALSSIPAGNLETYFKSLMNESPDSVPDLTPVSIRVVLDADYANQLGRAVNSNDEISIELTEWTDVSTEERYMFFENEKMLKDNLSRVLGGEGVSDDE